ncbi:hypothetical protein ACJX0J_004276 [Zea mays]
MKVQERILNLVGGFKLKNMGQKINPLGFRLGTTQNHHSFWFAQPKNYSEGLQEDKKITELIGKKALNRKMESDSSSEVITHIEIQKEIDTIHKKGAIEELEKDLQKEVNSKPYRQPNILVSFRKAMKKAIELTKKAGYKGNKNPNCGSQEPCFSKNP